VSVPGPWNGHTVGMEYKNRLLKVIPQRIIRNRQASRRRRSHLGPLPQRLFS